MIEVLTIDDEPLALQQLEAYIRKIPFFHLVASCLSAKEAWEVMEQHTVDVMFCDINMPDINGLDFVRSLDTPPFVVSSAQLYNSFVHRISPGGSCRHR